MREMDQQKDFDDDYGILWAKITYCRYFFVSFWFSASDYLVVWVGLGFLSNNPFHMEILGIQTTNPNHQLIIIVEVCAGDSRWFCQGYMLIASDGVWDFLSNEEVSSLVPWLQG